MTPESRLAKETCLKLFAELAAGDQALYEAPADSDDEVQACLKVEQVGQQISSLLALQRDNLEESLTLREEVYATALRDGGKAVRDGQTTYWDSALGYSCDTTKPGPYKLLLGVPCHGYFENAEQLGPLDDVGALQTWVCQRLLLPASQVHVHPLPSLPSLCLGEFSTLLHEIATADPRVAHAPYDYDWTSLPEGESEFDPEIVIFWVTVTVGTQEQFIRVGELIAEGGPDSEFVSFSLPFTMDGTPRTAIVAPLHLDWPMSAMTTTVFHGVVADIAEAVEALRLKGIAPENLAAELRVFAATEDAPEGTFVIELQEAYSNAVYTFVLGLDAPLAKVFYPPLQDIGEELGLRRVFTRLFWQD